jgi:hypothetical protein
LSRNRRETGRFYSAPIDGRHPAGRKDKQQENVMDKKIRELKLDEVKAVAGGATALSTTYVKPVSTTTVSASSLLIKPISISTFNV